MKNEKQSFFKKTFLLINQVYMRKKNLRSNEKFKEQTCSLNVCHIY
jgi:hypothetical protein